MANKMRKILLLVFTIFAAQSQHYSFAQNQTKDLAQVDLPDKTPTKNSGAAKSLLNKSLGKNLDTANPAIDKSQLLDTGNNVIAHTNDLVGTLLGTNKVSSLMFSDEELSDLERAIDSFKSGQTYTAQQDPKNILDAKKDKKIKDPNAEEENEKSYIYLASIIYYSPKEWALWINNLKITSDSNKNTKELFVKEIYPGSAKIVWSLSISKWKILSGKKSEDSAPKLNAKNNVEISFTLKPNQTFILGSSRVVEGRAVTNLVK
jgi:hypothetical protein